MLMSKHVVSTEANVNIKVIIYFLYFVAVKTL